MEPYPAGSSAFGGIPRATTRAALAAGVTLPEDALVQGSRHHFGVRLAIRVVSPATLQQLMGHTDPRTTALYIGHASRDLVNALDNVSWLARR